jgi:ribonuclease PH
MATSNAIGRSMRCSVHGNLFIEEQIQVQDEVLNS